MTRIVPGSHKPSHSTGQLKLRHGGESGYRGYFREEYDADPTTFTLGNGTWSVPFGWRLVDAAPLVRRVDVAPRAVGQRGDTGRGAGVHQQGQYVCGHAQ